MELPSLEKGNTQKRVWVEALGSEIWFCLLSLSCTLAIQVDRLSRQLAVGTEVREEVRAGDNLQRGLSVQEEAPAGCLFLCCKT